MLPKVLRITPKTRVQEVLDRGETLRFPLWIVKRIPRKMGPRFGLVLARHLRLTAVARNRLRRRIYEAIRVTLNERTSTIKPMDTMLIIRRPIDNIPFEKLKTLIRLILT